MCLGGQIALQKYIRQPQRGVEFGFEFVRLFAQDGLARPHIRRDFCGTGHQVYGTNAIPMQAKRVV